MQKQPIVNAIKQYATDNKLEISLADNGDITLMPGDILLQISDNGLVCNNSEVRAAIVATLPPEPTKGSNFPTKRSGAITSRQQATTPTNAAQAIQIMQSGKELTYQVNKKAAPNATMALMAATDAKIDLREINSILTDELASSTIRATCRNGRTVDATVSIRKTDFINLLAWKEVDAQEKIKNFILDDSDPLNIALPNGFPRIKPDAMVSIRVKGENSNTIEKRRAIVHIYIEAMQQWIFQQRQCQTKAKRNAIIQALTSSGDPMEVMEDDELADEQREREIVEESRI